jgi:hypothetical protein
MTCGEAVRNALAGSITLLALAACGAAAPAPTTDSFFFPRHAGALGAAGAARVEGVAVMGDGCLLLQAEDGQRYLPLWPQDTRLGMINSLPAILAADSELLVEVGDIDPNDRVELSGNEVAEESATELVGTVPERCAADRYWIVGDVLTRP